MKSLAKILISLILVLTPAALVGSSVMAFDFFHQACSAANSSGNQSATCQQAKQENTNPTNPVAGTNGVLQEAANVFTIVAVVGGLILIMYGAILVATAGGTRAGDSSTRVRQGRATITSALVGIGIVAIAWTVVTIVNTKILQ